MKKTEHTLDLELIVRSTSDELQKTIAADLLSPDPTEVFTVIIQPTPLEVKTENEKKEEDE